MCLYATQYCGCIFEFRDETTSQCAANSYTDGNNLIPTTYLLCDNYINVMIPTTYLLCDNYINVNNYIIKEILTVQHKYIWCINIAKWADMEIKIVTMSVRISYSVWCRFVFVLQDNTPPLVLVSQFFFYNSISPLFSYTYLRSFFTCFQKISSWCYPCRCTTNIIMNAFMLRFTWIRNRMADGYWSRQGITNRSAPSKNTSAGCRSILAVWKTETQEIHHTAL